MPGFPPQASPPAARSEPPAMSLSPPPHAPAPATRHPFARRQHHRTRPRTRQQTQRRAASRPAVASPRPSTRDPQHPCRPSPPMPAPRRSAAFSASLSRAPTSCASNGSSALPPTGSVAIAAKNGSAERIAVHQPVIEECQRQSLGVGLQPQRQLCQLDGQAVAIHAIQAMHGDQPSADRQRTGLRHAARRRPRWTARQIGQQQAIRIRQVRQASTQLRGTRQQARPIIRRGTLSPRSPQRRSPLVAHPTCTHTAPRQDSGTPPPESARCR